MNQLQQKSLEQQPPHNLEAEHAVLGAILLDNQAYETAERMLKAPHAPAWEAFYRPGHQKIFTAMGKLHEAGDVIDLLTLRDMLAKKHWLNEVGGESYLAALVDQVPTAANIEYHAKLVRQKHLARRIQNLNWHIISRTYDEAEDVETLLAEFISQASSLQHDDAPVDDQADQQLLLRKFTPKQEIAFDLTRQHPFLQVYADEMRKCTDAKPQTLITPFLAALAANIGNRAFIQNGSKRHFCNVWSIIIAPSTIGRKTTAINLAIKCLRDYNKELYKAFRTQLEEFRLIGEEGEPPIREYVIFPIAPAEKFANILSTNPNGLLVFSEIATFLSKMNKSYNNDFKSLITDWFDGTSSEYATLSRPGELVEHPSFSIATASTKEWFLQELDKENDVNSGFLQRFLVCNATDVEFDRLQFAYRETAPVNQFITNVLAKLYAQLRKVGTIDQPIELHLSDAAKLRYAEEYRETLRPYHKEHQAALFSYVGRLFEDYFFRFCTIFTLIDHLTSGGAPEAADHLDVSDTTAVFAHRLCHFYLSNIVGFLQSEIGENKEVRNEKKLVQIFRDRNADMLKRTTLMNLSNLYKKEFDLAIESLLQQDVLEALTAKAKNGKSTVYYKLLIASEDDPENEKEG